MPKTISVDALEAEFRHIVDEKLEDVNAKVGSAVRKGGKATVDGIRSHGEDHKITGEYLAGWRVKTEGGTLSGYTATVYNETRPGLPHLIEFGHGGPQPAPAHPHIADAYEEGVKVFEAELKKAVT